MTKDDDVLMEIYETELLRNERHKKERTQAKKDKMKERVKNNLAKMKAAEDEFMKQPEQNQRDDLEFTSPPVTGGASSSQGPLPPKTPKTQKARVERSRSRDQEPKTPKSEMKSEMKSESEATPKIQKDPKENKIKIKKEMEKNERTQKNKERRTTRRDES
jgi:hypothetical protein